MSEIAFIYLIVSLAGIYSVIASLARIIRGHDARERRKSVFSLFSAFVYIAICGVTIYVSLLNEFSSLTIISVSCLLLVLNELLLWKVLKSRMCGEND